MDQTSLGMVFKYILLIFLLPKGNFAQSRVFFLFIYLLGNFGHLYRPTGLEMVFGSVWIVFFVPKGNFTHFHLRRYECTVNHFFLTRWSLFNLEFWPKNPNFNYFYFFIFRTLWTLYWPTKSWIGFWGCLGNFLGARRSFYSL